MLGIHFTIFTSELLKYISSNIGYVSFDLYIIEGNNK